MRITALFVVGFLAGARSQIIESFLDYQIPGDNEIYEGYFAYDASLPGPLPAVMVNHAFWGLDENSMFWTKKWAEQGYFAFASDVYTKFIRPTTVGEAGGNATFLRSNPEILRRRAVGAYQVMLGFPMVDPSLGVATCGYCFGVATSYELVRALPVPAVDAAIGFHGGVGDLMGTLAPDLNNRFPPDTHIQYHGAGDDAGVSDEHLAMFESNLREQNIETWSVHQYRPAGHGFADVASAIYNELASTQAHFAMFQALLHMLPGGTFLKKDVDYSRPDDIKIKAAVTAHYTREFKLEKVEGMWFAN